MTHRVENWIYVIGAMEHMGRVKIGVTNNVETRMRDLQPGSPFLLHLWGIFPAHKIRSYALETERAIHIHLAEKRLHGEWFAVHPKEALEVAERFSRLAPAKITAKIKGVVLKRVAA